MKIKLILAASLVAIFSTHAKAKTCMPVISVTGEGLNPAAADYDARLNWSFNAEQLYGKAYANWAMANNAKVTFKRLKPNKWSTTATGTPCK